MPIVGSVVLFSLFVTFYVFPKDLVNLCLTAYFLMLGTFAVAGIFLPFIDPFFSKVCRSISSDY
jgi:minor histocompatibility antigen H13